MNGVSGRKCVMNYGVMLTTMFTFTTICSYQIGILYIISVVFSIDIAVG